MKSNESESKILKQLHVRHFLPSNGKRKFNLKWVERFHEQCVTYYMRFFLIDILFKATMVEEHLHITGSPSTYGSCINLYFT